MKMIKRQRHKGTEGRKDFLSVPLCLCGLILLFSAKLHAQPAPPSETAPQVYVHDSTEVMYKVALADRMAHLGQWDTAANTLQEIINKNSDRVVPTQTDPQGRPTQYAGAGSVAQSRLAGWPAEGLAVYRGKFESTAAGLLKHAGDDPAALGRIVDEYFVTSAAKTAAGRLIDQCINAGQFAQAAWTGKKFLLRYPHLDADRPGFLFRTALADHLQGDDAEAKKYLDELRTKFPQSIGIVGGKDVLLADSLAELLKVAPPVDQRSANYWPTFGGGESRDRIIASQMQPTGSPLLSVNLSKPSDSISFGESPSDQKIRQQQDHDAGIWLNVWPVMDGERIYFQDRDDIRARNIETGLAPRGWIDYSAGQPGGATGTSLAVTLSGDSLFAITGQGRSENAMPMGMMGLYPDGAPKQLPPTQLICLDRATGNLRWSAGPADLPEQGSLRALNFSSCPLVTDDNVYVLARGGRGGQFDDCYLVCFQQRTGKFQWASYIASATLGNIAFGESNGPTNNISHLSCMGERIFVQSNVGAVAAVDAFSGNILWLDVYSRRSVMPNFGPRRFGGAGFAQAKPWTFNSPIVRNGRVFVLPSDSENVLVCDAFTGREMQQLNRSDFDQPDTLLAVDGDRLLFSSDDKLWCVNWQTYDADKFSAGDQQSIIWEQDFRESPIQGRSLVTQQVVYVPTKRLYRIDMRTGKIIDTFPPLSQPLPTDGPGNVLVTNDKLIFAGSDRIDVYANPAAAIAQLEAQEQVHPDDAELLLRHAALIFAGGDVSAAIAKLDQLRVSPVASGNDLRQRIFDLTMQWISHVESQSSVAQVEQLGNLFDRAAAMANTAEQRANYCMARAQYAQDHKDWATVVAMQQQILADAAAREISIAQPDGHTLPAGQIAQETIAAMQQGGNEQFYAPYQEQALTAIQKARQGAQAAELLAVAQQYPNSSVAGDALRESAAAYLAAGNAAESASVFHELLITRAQPVDRRQIFQAIANAALLTNSHLVEAIAWLQRAGDQPLQSPLRLPDGQLIQDVSSNQAALQLQAISERQEDDARPEFNWGSSSNPLEHQGPAIAGVEALLTPANSSAPAERMIGWSAADGLRLFATDSGQMVAQNSDFAQEPFAAEWSFDRLLITDPYQLTLLRGDDAKEIWRINLQSLPPIPAVAGTTAEQKIIAEQSAGQVNVPMAIAPNMILIRGGVLRFGPGGWVPVSAPENAVPAEARIIESHVAGNRAIFATGDGRLIALHISDGSLAWQLRLGTDPIARMQANDFFAVAKIGRDAESKLVVVDLFTGRIVRSIASSEAAQPINFSLSTDDQLIFTAAGQICRVDLDDRNFSDISARSTPEDLPRFSGMNQPAQLLISHDRILAVSHTGALVQNASLQTDAILSTLGSGATPGATVQLTVAWPHLYIIGVNTLTACDLTNGGSEQWTVPPEVQIADILIGRNKLLVRGQGGRLLVYSRESTAHGESGRLEFDNGNSQPIRIESWQAIAGGFCYLKKDHTLHIVRGE
jgi:outer membrane protein assembly factor BamB